MRALATLAIFTLVLLVAFVTNPEERRHEEAVAEAYAGIIGVNPDNILYDALSTVATKYVVEVDNYYFFSVTRIGDYRIGVGLFNRNIIFTERLIKKLRQ